MSWLSSVWGLPARIRRASFRPARCRRISNSVPTCTCASKPLLEVAIRESASWARTYRRSGWSGLTRSSSATRAMAHLQRPSPSRVRALGGGGIRTVESRFAEVHVNGSISNLPAISVGRRGTRWHTLARSGTRCFVALVYFSCPTEGREFRVRPSSARRGRRTSEVCPTCLLRRQRAPRGSALASTTSVLNG
jgi:hypothetical protein